MSKVREEFEVDREEILATGGPCAKNPWPRTVDLFLRLTVITRRGHIHIGKRLRIS
jgi:hypothetical protein